MLNALRFSILVFCGTLAACADQKTEIPDFGEVTTDTLPESQGDLPSEAGNTVDATEETKETKETEAPLAASAADAVQQDAAEIPVATPPAPVAAVEPEQEAGAPADNLVPVPQYASVDDAAENALDWAGRYTGTLPCSDCSGVRTELMLSYEETYRLSATYLESRNEPILNAGKTEWDATGSILTLKGTPDRQVFVAEDKVIFLSPEEPGKMDPLYALTKTR